MRNETEGWSSRSCSPRARLKCWRTWRSTSRRSVSASSARMRRNREHDPRTRDATRTELTPPVATPTRSHLTGSRGLLSRCPAAPRRSGCRRRPGRSPQRCRRGPPWQRCRRCRPVARSGHALDETAVAVGERPRSQGRCGREGRQTRSRRAGGDSLLRSHLRLRLRPLTTNTIGALARPRRRWVICAWCTGHEDLLSRATHPLPMRAADAGLSA
jgi:hypothetical protein